MRPTRRPFITLEGIDGSGTTTQAQRLVDWLRENGRQAHLTQEPSDLSIGRQIRRYLQEGGCPPESMALLFAADRIDHLRNEIEPRLARGQVVISDRYLLSSLAYQSVENRFEWVREINRHAPLADLTLILALDPDLAAQRRASRLGPVEIYEVPQFQRDVAQWYTELPRLLDDQRIITLDASGDADAVFSLVRGQVQALLTN